MNEAEKYLEECKENREECTIRYRAFNEAVSEVKGRVMEFHTEEGARIVKLDSLVKIPIDRILSINGQYFEGFC